MCVWTGGTRGYTWEFLVGSAARFSKSWPCLRPKKKSFFTPVSDVARKEIMALIVSLEQQQKRFLKSHYEFEFFSFFLIHLILKRYVRSYAPSFDPLKTIWFHADLNEQSLYPFLDQNSAKPLPFGVAHTYVAYIREYPSWGSNGKLTEKVGERFNLRDQWWWRVTYDVIQHRLRNFPLLLISCMLFHVDRPFYTHNIFGFTLKSRCWLLSVKSNLHVRPPPISDHQDPAKHKTIPSQIPIIRISRKRF